MRYYSNSAAQTTLASSITSSDTAVTVASVTGFPVTFPFTLVIDPDTINAEIITVTALAGSVLTVTRGQDGTAGVTHSAGAVVSHDHTARDFQESRNHEAASTGVHGATGGVVGTSDTQTLTNKNLTSATNSFPASLATLTGVQALTNKTLTAPTINSPTVTTLTLDTVNVSGAWTAYTPTWAGQGNGTVSGRYMKIGKTVHFKIIMTVGSTTSTDGGTNWEVGLPTAPQDLDGVVAPAMQTIPVDVLMTRSNASGNLILHRAGSTLQMPFAADTAVAGSVITINGTYEAA